MTDTNDRTGPDPALPDGVASGEEGFALSAVVLLLLLVTMMAATGYELARSDSVLRRAAEQTVSAEEIAHGGMARYMMVDPDRTVGQTATYSLAGGEAEVRARRIRASTSGDQYLLTSVGTYQAPGSEAPATRLVREYVTVLPLLRSKAALTHAAGQVGTSSSTSISGFDAAGSGACSAPASTAGGVLAAGAVSEGGSSIAGSPETKTTGSHAATLDTLGLDWESLEEESFEVDYEDAWPDFDALSTGAFPVIRMNGDISATSDESGRGLLVVTGVFQPGSNWVWDGVVLAGDLQFQTATPAFTVWGLLASGLRYPSTWRNLSVPGGVTVQYHRCNISAALEQVTQLRPLLNAQFEEF